MASEDIFEDDFSEEITNEIDQEYAAELDENSNDEFEVSGALAAEANNEKLETNDIANEPSENKTRLKGHSSPKVKLFQLPLTRVRNLMKLDPDLHIASNEAVFAVTRSSELFIESLAREAYTYTAQAKKKTIQKRDVDLAMTAVDSLMFLDGAMNF